VHGDPALAVPVDHKTIVYHGPHDHGRGPVDEDGVSLIGVRKRALRDGFPIHHHLKVLLQFHSDGIHLDTNRTGA